MLPNIVVGVIFTGIIIFAFTKARNDIKNNKCGGCSGCSKKSQCHK